MSRRVIEIEGMHSNSCKASIEEILKSIRGISTVDVSLERKTATVEANSAIDDIDIKRAIERAGFRVSRII